MIPKALKKRAQRRYSFFKTYRLWDGYAAGFIKGDRKPAWISVTVCPPDVTIWPRRAVPGKNPGLQ